MKEILIFLAIGAVAGWLASLAMKKDSGSLLKNIIVGIVGGLIGGWLFPMIGIQFAGLIGTIIMAAGGAVLLLFVLSKF